MFVLGFNTTLGAYLFISWMTQMSKCSKLTVTALTCKTCYFPTMVAIGIVRSGIKGNGTNQKNA